MLDKLKAELKKFKNLKETDLDDKNFDVDIYKKMKEIERKIIELELNYSFSDFNNFDRYLIQVGIRSSEYGYKDDVLFENVDYFKRCYVDNLSAYKALLFLEDYLNDLNDFSIIY